VEQIRLIPGINGGYQGGSEDLVVPNERGRSVSVVDTEAKGPPYHKIIPKPWGNVILSNRPFAPKGWLLGFIKEHEVVYLDWSPAAGRLAASASRNGGVIEILMAKPGAEPSNLSMELSRLPIRSLKVEEKR